MEEIRLMPKAVALWLKINTTLTKEQIGMFCKLNLIELEAINEQNTIGINPITETKELTVEEIKKCEQNPNLHLKPYKKIYVKNNKNMLTKMQKLKIPGVILWLMHYSNKDFNVKLLSKFLRTTTTFLNKKIKEYEDNQLDAIAVNPIREGFLSEKDLKKLYE